jgi:hypothetical protein
MPSLYKIKGDKARSTAYNNEMELTLYGPLQ